MVTDDPQLLKDPDLGGNPCAPQGPWAILSRMSLKTASLLALVGTGLLAFVLLVHVVMDA